MPMHRLYETIDEDTFFTAYGIFTKLQATTSLTWLTSDMAHALDIDYYYNHSNEKWISPLLNKLFENDNESLSTGSYNILTNIILTKFKDKWDRLYEAFVTKEYDPIENYSMIEDTSTASDIDTSNSVYGFNSTTAVPSATQNVNGTKLNNTEHHTRSGNIGVTTSQQMLESEIKIREWNLYNQLMKDIDSVLCLKVY